MLTLRALTVAEFWLLLHFWTHLAQNTCMTCSRLLHPEPLLIFSLCMRWSIKWILAHYRVWAQKVIWAALGSHFWCVTFAKLQSFDMWTAFRQWFIWHTLSFACLAPIQCSTFNIIYNVIWMYVSCDEQFLDPNRSALFRSS